MKRICGTVLLGLAVSSVTSAALAADKDAVHPVDAAQTRCLDKAVSTVDMLECNAKAMTAWDAELNLQYRKLLQGQSAGATRALKEAQRAWVQYRDSYFKAMNAYYQQEQGTIWGIVAGDRKIQVVREKALDLKQLADSRKLE
jgi:uncharacterized protein YecT (DUF1311 family)